jgi:hypothetical protein
MKQRRLLIFFLTLFLANVAFAQVSKTIDVGRLEAVVFDDGIQSTTNKPMSHIIYPRGSLVTLWDYVNTTTYMPGGIMRNAGTLVGHRNWTDTTGRFWPYHISGHCNRESFGPGDPYQFSVPDELGYTIHRYYRYPPPQIVIDGMHVEKPFPTIGDEVAPEKMWGSADLMIECHYRLSNGLDVYQRNLAWSQPDHDDYIVWDLTFVNTGNTDRDEDIELQDQTLDSVVIMKHYEGIPNGGMYPYGSWCGVTEDQNARLSYPQDDDSLRMSYYALSRKAGHDYDPYGGKCEIAWAGNPDSINGTRWPGHVTLFAPRNTSVPQTHPISDIAASNDPAQPSMYSTIEDFGSYLSYLQDLVDTSDFRIPYRCMRKGIWGYEDTTIAENTAAQHMNLLYDVYDTTATGAKTWYDIPQDRIQELDPNLGHYEARTLPYYDFSTQPKFSIGPYNMAFGDTIRFVFAVAVGSIDPKGALLLGRKYSRGDARNFEWLAEMDSAEIREEYTNRDPVAEIYGEIDPSTIWRGGGLNAMAKDYVVATGRDSLFISGMRAQRNFNSNYNIPASPAPPSVFEVWSRPDAIELSWSYEAGYEPSDLAGFKIYRAQGGTKFTITADSTITGEWEMIDSVGPDENSLNDVEGITSGFDYYYCITAISSSGIESGKWLTMTKEPFAARLTDQPKPDLDSVAIVPNPMNVREDNGFPESEHKIIFKNLPGECTIRIFTESGELVRTIEHTDGSGSAFWQDQWYLTTANNQRPASGLYIAHIQMESGEWTTRKFLIVR